MDVIKCIRKLPDALKAAPTAPMHVCKTTLVSVIPERFFAVEGFKMTRCPANGAEGKPQSRTFIDILVLPLGKVSGVEDVRRPDGIWDFAWKFARTYIPDDNSIVLAVNSNTRRSQDQLHIHIMRLLPEVGDRIRKLNPQYMDSLVGSPDPVWAAAERHSHGQLESGNFGVVVLYDRTQDKFAVVATTDIRAEDLSAPCPVTQSSPDPR